MLADQMEAITSGLMLTRVKTRGRGQASTKDISNLCRGNRDSQMCKSSHSLYVEESFLLCRRFSRIFDDHSVFFFLKSVLTNLPR